MEAIYLEAIMEASLNKGSIDFFPLFMYRKNLKYSLNLFSLQALYMFYALAIVCDDFFVPSLEKICEVC